MRTPVPSETQERILLAMSSGKILWTDTMSHWTFLQGDPPNVVIPSSTLQALLKREWIYVPHPGYVDTGVVRYDITELGRSALRTMGGTS